MPDETTAPVEQAVDSEKENLKAELEAMRKKNAELLDETKKAKAKAKAVPDVDVQALIDFKNNAEQAELEKQGKYTEARTKLEDQYREKSSEDKKRIAELESKFEQQENAKLKEKEEWKALSEKLQAQLDEVSPYKDKHEKMVSDRKEALLSLIPEDQREKFKNKDLETIEFVTENNPNITKEEIIKEVLEIKHLGETLTEGLCKRGKNYIAARKRAGEKSSAYLSGRGVKVCKGQIKGSDGQKKKG